ncbi:Sugar phosphate permease [Dyella sp. OK004]|uniref:MFS transporter n=1 Tax=Dyella sp. OK004 TaxID=1855292 RepID=UPI0008E2E72B|nr:MFS transporter [Dyella sp. OK004]SFS16446.1 Sugar phosphate permease [Dyella sp. OK004]
MPDALPIDKPHTLADRLLVLASVCLAGLAMPLCFTGPAMALPAIGHALGSDPVMLSWVVNAFILAFGGFVMASGTLADQYGRKRIFTLGIALFTVMSLLLALAPNLLALDVLRALQGVAAALTMSSGAASLAQEFEGRARTRAYSLLGTTFGLGLAFGPLLSAYLIDAFGWRSVFVAIAAMGVLVLVLGVPRMRETRDPEAQGLDLPGTLSFTGALALLTFAIIEAPQRGWASGMTLILFAASLAMFVLFVLVEQRVRGPMLDLTLFRNPRFLGAQALPIATALCYVVLLIFLPLRFVGVEGRGEVTAGLLMIPLSAPMLVVPLVGALLTRWLSAATLTAIGLLVAAIGLTWLRGAMADPSASWGTLAWPLLMIGSGAGLPWGLMDDLAVSVVPKERAGMATGFFTTTRVAGEALAMAATGAALATVIELRLSGQPAAQVAAAASNLATGNLLRAALQAPAIGRATLLHTYVGAFSSLLIGLAWLTAGLAVLSFVLLRKPHPHLTATYVKTPEPSRSCPAT